MNSNERIVFVVGFDIDNCDSELNLFEFKKNNIQLLDSCQIATMPSSFYYSSKHNLLYVTDELNNKNGLIHVFEIKNKRFNHIQTCQTFTSNPCYITSDKNEKLLYVCNYTEGGLIEANLDTKGMIKSIKHDDLYDDRCCHFCLVEDSFLAIFYTADNYVKLIYNDSIRTTRIIPINSPRQGVFLNKYKKLYILSENESVLHIYDLKTNHFTDYFTVHDCQIENHPSSIAINKGNNKIIVSNRGNDSITIFDVEKNGLLNSFKQINLKEKCPRDISLLKENNTLGIAFKESNIIELFEFNNEFNQITRIGSYCTPAPIGLYFLEKNE